MNLPTPDFSFVRGRPFGTARRALSFAVMVTLYGGLRSVLAEDVAGASPAPALAAVVERVEPWAEHELQLRERLLTIAAEYIRYGRVDDESRWAPELCRMPFPSLARFSAADNRDGHGQKLYFLFARDRAGYVNLGQPSNALAKPRFQPPAKGDDQIIVKESWLPEVVKGVAPPNVERDTLRDPRRSEFLGGSYYPLVKKDGKTYRAAKKAGLYIMLQSGARAGDQRAGGDKSVTFPRSETDAGWLYGTVTADGKTVTAAGKIGSCVECHQQAPHGRLFGLSKAAAGARPN